MSLEAVVRTLEEGGVRFALIGAVALAARGVSRSTLDLDLMTTDKRVLNDDFWAAVRESGAAVDVRKGDHDDPLAGVVRITSSEAIDVVVGKYRWEKDLIERAEPVVVRKLTIPLPSRADLILLKLSAGGHRDLEDVRRLLELGPREELIVQVGPALDPLPQVMRDRWTRLLGSEAIE